MCAWHGLGGSGPAGPLPPFDTRTSPFVTGRLGRCARTACDGNTCEDVLVPHPPDETALLHHGGRSGAWGSLGLWADESDPADPADYAGACEALARATAQAAGLRPGDRVLSVACGQGEELRLWVQQFHAAEVVGIEADAARARQAARLGATLPGVAVRTGSGTRLGALGLPAAGFDRVLCVDAAYHLAPRAAFLRAAWALLRPGGTLAYTDLVGPDAPGPGALLLSGAAALCGLDRDVLAPEATHLQRLHDAGFVAPRLQRLDDAVLGGFVRFVHRQSRGLPGGRWQAGWRRVATTAWLIPHCRAAGLGYALISATRPPVDPEAAPPQAATRAATASAERTALSSSGTPASA